MLLMKTDYPQIPESEEPQHRVQRSQTDLSFYSAKRVDTQVTCRHDRNTLYWKGVPSFRLDTFPLQTPRISARQALWSSNLELSGRILIKFRGRDLSAYLANTPVFPDAPAVA